MLRAAAGAGGPAGSGGIAPSVGGSGPGRKRRRTAGPSLHRGDAARLVLGPRSPSTRSPDLAGGGFSMRTRRMNGISISRTKNNTAISRKSSTKAISWAWFTVSR